MHRIDTDTAALLLPTPGAAETPGFFTEGDPQTGEKPTTVSADWLNALQEEVSAVPEAAGLVLSKADRTQLLQGVLLLAGGLDDSWLDNGGMVLQSRIPEASSPTPLATKAFGALDRWMIDPGDGRASIQAVGVSQIGTSGGATMPEWVRAYVAFGPETTAATADPCKLVQRFLIDNVEALSGKKITASFWGKLADASAAASRNVTLRLRIHFGTGGGPSADITLTGTAHAVLKTIWARYSTTFTVPNMDTMTKGNTWAYAELQLRLDVSHPVSTGAERILATGIKVQPGTVPTSFVYPRENVEEDRCRRFYETSNPRNQSLATSGQAGAVRGYEAMGDNLAQTLSTRFRTEKPLLSRYATAPAIVWYSPTTQAANTIDAGGLQLAVTGNNQLSPVDTGYPTTLLGVGAVDVAAHYAADFEIR